MKLGLRRGTVAVVPHCIEWEAAAEQTVTELKEILKDAAADVQHVGSTAIRGISAKPIIDIAVGMPDPERILAMNGALEEKGYIFRGSDLPGQYLYVRGEGECRTHHIHVLALDSKARRDYINFRDYLNCHEEDARAYSALKEALAEQYPGDRETYTAMKSGFINEILEKACVWRGE